MLKLLNLLFKHFAHTRFGRWFFNSIVGKYTFRNFGYTTFPMKDFFILYDRMKEYFDKNNGNCVFLFASCDTLSLAGFLLRKLLKSKHSHAGIIDFNFDLKDLNIFHMKGNGFNKWHILDLLKEVDNFSVVGIPLSFEQMQEYRRRIAILKVGSFLLKYDFSQELIQTEDTWINFERDLITGRKIFNLYCSELCYVVLSDFLNLQPKQFLGRIIFEPDDVLKIGEILYQREV